MFLLILYTIGKTHYKEYVFPVFITEDLNVFQLEESHEYYIIFHIKSGICRFNLNEKEYVLIGAHILSLNEHDRISFIEMSDVSVSIILFQPQIVNTSFNVSTINDPDIRLTVTANQDLFYLEQFKHSTPEDKKIMSLTAIDSTIMESRINRLNHTLSIQDTSFWPCLSRSYLYEILFTLVRKSEFNSDNEDPENYSGHSKLTIDIIYYLQSRYNQKITVDKLAEEFHTNRTTIHIDFKKHTGLSINQYLLQLRMNFATKLLRDTSLSLSEICDRIGFSDISYFSKAFKKTLNQTPSEYRNINR